MKKLILFIFVIVAMITITSCSSFSKEDVINGTSVENMDDSKTVVALTDYNSKLMAACQLTRGRKLNTALADVVGALQGLSCGKDLAGIAGVATGGVGFWAVAAGTALLFGGAASYTAYKSYTCSYATNTSDLYNFTKSMVMNKFALEKNDTLLDVKDDVVDDSLSASADDKVKLPEDFGYVRTLGVDHNAILLAANVTGKLPEINEVESSVMEQIELTPEDYAKFNDVMNSDELWQAFEAEADNLGNKNSLDALTNCSLRVKQALQGYLDLFEIYPDNADDVAEIANGYIKIIEENNEFTAEEKELIYSAIMVSVYSPQFWAEIELK